MKKVFATFLMALCGLALFAQEKATDININLNKESDGANWYASPWIWVVGAAVFILLLVALSGRRRSSGSSDRVTVTKTVRRDSDN